MTVSANDMPVSDRLLPSSGPPSDAMARASAARRAACGDRHRRLAGVRDRALLRPPRRRALAMLARSVASFSHSEAAMLVGSAVRRVAIVGGLRIPFARSMGAYAEASNQEMLTATLKALVDRYDLRGAALGDVGAGAVLKHSQDFNLTRECVLDSGLGAGNAGVRSAARLRHEPRYGDRHRPEDRDGTDRFGHRRAASTRPATCRSSIRSRIAICCCAARAADRSASACRPGSACGRAISSRSCPAWSSRAPACRWARLRADGARPGRSRAPSRISSRWKAIARRRPRRTKASSTIWWSSSAA